MIVTSTTKRREMIHWLWLWTLAGIEHFRRAIQLAPKCDLNATIEVTPTREPQIRLTALGVAPTSRVTVRHLLISLHEVDFLEKAQREIGERAADPPATTIMSSGIASR